ncbi:MAG: hypothetical protein Q4C34_05850, partial [Bacteroidales bacterium]|nr:hypothetical protein [Bacteroidales bacterium]
MFESMCFYKSLWRLPHYRSKIKQPCGTVCFSAAGVGAIMSAGPSRSRVTARHLTLVSLIDYFNQLLKASGSKQFKYFFIYFSQVVDTAAHDHAA